MKRRLYFLLPDHETSSKVVDELLLARIPERDIHVVAREGPRTDCLIMAAAPADFRPARAAKQKRSRNGGATTLALSPTPDILGSTRAKRKRGGLVIGFAYETGNAVQRARAKLKDKGLDLIVFNRADDPEAGAEVETNRVTIISADDATALPLLPKREVAERILDAAEGLL